MIRNSELGIRVIALAVFGEPACGPGLVSALVIRDPLVGSVRLALLYRSYQALNKFRDSVGGLLQSRQLVSAAESDSSGYLYLRV